MIEINTMPAQPVLLAGEPSRTAVAALADVLRSESRLLSELVGLMKRQREAVAADDLQAVEESVYATHRVLHTLNEARRRRRSINRMLGESDDLSIRELDSALGGGMSEELRSARDDLETVARALSEEVDVNRRVLRQALANGDDYVRTLCGTAEQKVAYAPRSQTGEPERSGGFLLNRLA